MKVCILYGWTEGQAHGKKFRAALRQAGLTITRHVDQADVIVAHSGGSFLLPERSHAQLVLLIGLPYWPGRHPLRNLPTKIRQELRDLAWYRKSFFSTYYLLTRPRRWIRMWQGWKHQRLPAYEKSTIVLIRNHNDAFMHPTDATSLADDQNWQLRTLPGQHDDLWTNPGPYVREIQKYMAR